jgi:hypothetical protein
MRASLSSGLSFSGQLPVLRLQLTCASPRIDDAVGFYVVFDIYE